MQTMQIGRSGVMATNISIGTFAIGGGTAWSDTKNDPEGFIRLLHEANDLGVNFFDTAPVYGLGNGEEILGRAIADRRDRIILGTKCGLNWREEIGLHEYSRNGKNVYRCFTPAAIRGDLEDSLRRLGTDYIDVYITHRQPEISEIPQLMDTLTALKKEGKIRAIGISNATIDHVRAYLACGQIDLAQEQLSLLGRTRLDEYIPLCEQNAVTFQTYRALEEGALTGKLLSDFAPPAGDTRANLPWFRPGVMPRINAMLEDFRPLCEKYQCSFAVLVCAWVRGQSECINLLVGARRSETLRDTLNVQNVTLTAEELAFMTEKAKALNV